MRDDLSGRPGQQLRRVRRLLPAWLMRALARRNGSSPPTAPAETHTSETRAAAAHAGPRRATRGGEAEAGRRDARQAGDVALESVVVHDGGPVPFLHEPWLTPARLASLVVVLLASYGALIVVRALRDILLMLLLSIFLSFAMEPGVQYLARRGWKRGTATGAVFAAVLISTAGFVAAMAPLLINQVTDLVQSAPQSVDDALDLVSRLPFGIEVQASAELRQEIRQFGNEFGDELRNLALGAASNVVNLGATAVGLVLRLLAVALVTFYLVADGPRLRQTIARPLPQARQREMLVIWELAVAKTGGYIYSRILLAVVAAGVHAVFLLLIGIPYPVPLALWVGLTSAFVPVVGTYLGGILVLIVALLDEPIDALWVAVFVALYQQIENYLVAPRLQARTMDVHPAVAFVSVIIGGTLLGAVGALLALPATAIVQALLSTYVRRHELIQELREMDVTEAATVHAEVRP